MKGKLTSVVVCADEHFDRHPSFILGYLEAFDKFRPITKLIYGEAAAKHIKRWADNHHIPCQPFTEELVSTKLPDVVLTFEKKKNLLWDALSEEAKESNVEIISIVKG